MPSTSPRRRGRCSRRPRTSTSWRPRAFRRRSSPRSSISSSKGGGTSRPAGACWCTRERRAWGLPRSRSRSCAARASPRRRARQRSWARSRPQGADLAIDAGRTDFAAEIEGRWGRDAVDVVLDPIGATSLPGDLRVLAPGGRVVVIATMGGAVVETDLGLLMRKRARLVGSTLRSRSRAEKAAIVARFREELLSSFDAGKGGLRVTVDSAFPPARAAEAFQRLRENRNVGKIVIAWGDR